MHTFKGCSKGKLRKLFFFFVSDSCLKRIGHFFCLKKYEIIAQILRKNCETMERHVLDTKKRKKSCLHLPQMSNEHWC